MFLRITNVKKLGNEFSTWAGKRLFFPPSPFSEEGESCSLN